MYFFLLPMLVFIFQTDTAFGEVTYRQAQETLSSDRAEPDESDSSLEALNGTWTERGWKCSSEADSFQLDGLNERVMPELSLEINGNNYNFITHFPRRSVEASMNLRRQHTPLNRHIEIDRFGQCMRSNGWNASENGQLTLNEDETVTSQAIGSTSCSYLGFEYKPYELYRKILRMGVNENHLFLRLRSSGCPGGFADLIFSAPIYAT